MKLIQSSTELMPWSDPFIHIEKIGRVCYKSTSDFTHESGVKFFNSLVKNKHHSVLEHATFIFEACPDILMTSGCTVLQKIASKKYLHWTRSYDANKGSFRTFISGNLRAIKESGIHALMLPLLKVYPEFKEYFGSDLSESPKESTINKYFTLLSRQEFLSTNPIYGDMLEHLYTTISFTTDRGVSHEIVRHRPASFSQESTRYCNYSKDKFGNELEFIKPANFDSWLPEHKSIYLHTLKEAEMSYMHMVREGMSPQNARGVLPTEVRTQIVMTANAREWKHFFDLRVHGVTGAPHPNMKEVAEKALKEYNSQF